MAINPRDPGVDPSFLADSTATISSAATAPTDWRMVEEVLGSPFMNSSSASRRYVSNPHPPLQPLQPVPEPLMSDQDIAKFRGQLLLKLLEIESTRCNAKTDEDDRTDSLAQVLEGDTHIIDRLQSGMSKYMALLGIDDTSPETMSIAEMQGNSVLSGMHGTTTSHRAIAMTESQAQLWESIVRAFEHANMNIRRAQVMTADLHRGGRNSPEDQLTITFRVIR